VVSPPGGGPIRVRLACFCAGLYAMPLFPLILPAASFPPLRGVEFVPTISLELEQQCRLWISRCDFMHRDRRHTSQETVSIYALCWQFVRQRHKMAPLSLRSLWSAMSLVLCLSHLAANMAPSARLWSRLHVDATNAISSILMRGPGSRTVLSTRTVTRCAPLCYVFICLWLI